MNTETVIATLSVIMAFLGACLVVVTGYLGYLTCTLEKRIREFVTQEVNQRSSGLHANVEARLGLVDVAVEALCSMKTSPDADEITEELYFLRHISRLTSRDAGEINMALGALEAGGPSLQYLLPYVERIRSVGNWPHECEITFDRILRKMRNAAIARNGEGSK